MYRKPFKTPFLKSPQKLTDGESETTKDKNSQNNSSQEARIYLPVSKKLKLGDHGRTPSGSGSDSGNGLTKGVIRMAPGSQATKRPFLSLKKAVKAKEDVIMKVEKVETSGSGVELYFNVLWRKYTTKK